MFSSVQLKIITQERRVYEADVDQVTLPTAMGEITILPHHIPLLSILKAGEIVIKHRDQEIFLVISGGFVEIHFPNQITILADTAEHAEEIDEKRAQEAKERAEALLREKQKDTREYALLIAKIEKELARLHVVRRRRKNTTPLI